MRASWRFSLIDPDGRIAGLPAVLAAAGPRHADAAEIRFVDATSETALAETRRALGAGGERAPPAMIAVCRDGDELALSRALAAGCADALVFPLDALLLAADLDRIGSAASLARAVYERTRLLRRFDGGTAAAKAHRQPGARLQLSLRQVSGSATVALGQMLPPDVLLAHVDASSPWQRSEDERLVDLVFIGPEAIAARSRDLQSAERAAFRAEPPMLLVGSGHEPDQIAAALATGCADVLDLGWAGQRVRRRLSAWLDLAHSRSLLRALNEERRPSAAFDAVTGLFEANVLLEAVRMAQADSRERSAVLLLVSLAGMENLHRRAGYPAASRLLQAAGRDIARSLRAEDIVARLGPASFAMLIAGCDAVQADRIARRLADGIATTLSRSQPDAAIEPLFATVGLDEGETPADLRYRAEHRLRRLAAIPGRDAA